jgi:hypothetical protein
MGFLRLRRHFTYLVILENTKRKKRPKLVTDNLERLSYFKTLLINRRTAHPTIRNIAAAIIISGIDSGPIV